jgi:hypothetical protein
MQAMFEGSPSTVLAARIADELADGAIPCPCPHPATADRLGLPSPTLRCAECDAGTPGHPDRTPCAGCGAADAYTWTIWLDECSRVLVVARVCRGLRDERKHSGLLELAAVFVLRAER